MAKREWKNLSSDDRRFLMKMADDLFISPMFVSDMYENGSLALPSERAVKYKVVKPLKRCWARLSDTRKRQVMAKAKELMIPPMLVPDEFNANNIIISDKW